jgi:hypothetical protein
MKNRALQEILSQYPDDLEVLVDYGNMWDGEFIIHKKSLYHCSYTSKWEGNVDFYSIWAESCCYRDEIERKIVTIEIPTVKKEFLVIDC